MRSSQLCGVVDGLDGAHACFSERFSTSQTQQLRIILTALLPFSLFWGATNDRIVFLSSRLRRLRASSDFGVLEAFLAYLHRRGHRRTTVQRYVRQAEILLRSLGRRRRSIASVTEGDVRRFACRPKRRRRPRPDCHAALRLLLRHLRERGIVPRQQPSFPAHIERVLAAFDAHLRDVAGLAPATRLYRRRYAGEFIRSVFGTKPIRWSRVRPVQVHAFLAEYSRTGRGAAARVAAVSLRSFFRWLQFNGSCDYDLSVAIPTFRQWRHATLPSVLDDSQYRAFLATFDRTSVVGRRDYAFAVCMGDLGLRVAEVAELMIDDVNQAAGTLRIAAGKTRRGRILPLTQRVPQAIIAYLRRGRPASADQHLFLRHRTPIGGGVSRELIRGVVRRAFAKIVGCEGQSGTHILRHTAATRLHRAGADIKRVADILGHRSIDTAAIYAKVDLDRLSGVALPWPTAGEVQP